MQDKEPTPEQIREFWIGYGFNETQGGGWKKGVYKYPVKPNVDYGIFDGQYDLLPPIDLNNLWKFATNDIVEINIMYSSNCVSVDIEHKDGDFYEGHINVDSFEEAKEKTNLALFWVLDKARKEDTNGKV